MESYSTIYPVLAAFFFGSQYVPQKRLGKINTRNYNNTMTFGIFFTAISFFLMNLIIETPKMNIVPVLLAFSSGLIWQGSNILSITGINRIGMSKTSCLLNLISVFSFIFGITIYSEEINIFKIIGLGITVVGAIIVATTQKDETEKFDLKGVIYVLCAAFIISIFNVISIDSMVSKYHPTISYYSSVLMMSIGAIIGGFIFNFRPKNLRIWMSEGKKFHLSALTGGFIWGCGILLTSYTLANFGLSFGVPIIQAVMIIISTFWGIVYFKEITKKTAIIKFLVGVIISIIGIIFFNL